MLYYKVEGYVLLVIWSGFNQTLTMRLCLAIHVSDLQNVTEQRVIKLQLLIFCTLDLFWVTRVAGAENDTDHVTWKMEPLLQLVKMD